MLAGAIFVVGQSSPETRWASNSWRRVSEAGMLGGNPIACLEVLGGSVLDRMVQATQRDGVKLITIVVRDKCSQLVRTSATQAATIASVPSQGDLWSAAECALRGYVQHGVELVWLTQLGAYMELDLGHIIRFHRDTKQGITILTKDHAPLDSWIIDAAEVRKTQRIGLPSLIDRKGVPGVIPYHVPGYVCSLAEAIGLRQLAVDGLLSRCSIRPRGREVKAGVWLDDGVQIHRRARIVAPTYLGCGTKLRADTLITRFSALERGCQVQDGTVIEDSSVLANTCVGKGLHVARAIVDGRRLLPLERHVVIEIQDSRLLSRTLPVECPRPGAEGATAASLAERILATAWN